MLEGGAFLTAYPNRLQVTAALIIRGNTVLITFRPSQARWEFPGGTLEPNESLEDCLVREIREELELDIIVGRPFLSVDHDGEAALTLHAFICRIQAGEPAGIPGKTFIWARKNHLSCYNFLPADKLIVKEISETDGFFSDAAGEVE
jgi:8-oxo-dGTP diphosphatase